MSADRRYRSGELSNWKALKYLDVQEDPVSEKALAALLSRPARI